MKFVFGDAGEIYVVMTVHVTYKNNYYNYNLNEKK